MNKKKQQLKTSTANVLNHPSVVSKRLFVTTQSATVLLKTQSLSGWWSIEGAVAQGMVIYSALQANFPLKQNIFKASLLRPEFIVKMWSEMSVRLVFLEGNYNKNYLSLFYRGKFFMEKKSFIIPNKNIFKKMEIILHCFTWHCIHFYAYEIYCGEHSFAPCFKFELYIAVEIT